MDALTQYGCSRIFHDKMSGQKDSVLVRGNTSVCT
ncbi:hypothetical protein [Peribacillus sp. YIM B13482]